jgi:hypothetical protein
VIFLDNVQRTKLDTEKAINALETAGWPREDISECLSISKRKVESIAEEKGRQTKVRGAIKAEREKVLSLLDSAGCVSKYLEQRITVKKES